MLSGSGLIAVLSSSPLHHKSEPKRDVHGQIILLKGKEGVQRATMITGPRQPNHKLMIWANKRVSYNCRKIGTKKI